MKLTKKHALLISVLAILMALCTIAGATLAYLFVTSQQVVNTFSPTNIDITLVETKNDFDMVPGNTIEKDPKVTVENDDFDCYVFVKVKEGNNLTKYISYTMADGWLPLANTTGVYYRVVASDATTKTFSVLANDQVTVNSTVLKTDMDALKTAGESAYPTLTFKAAAVQVDKLDVAAAYALVQADLNS